MIHLPRERVYRGANKPFFVVLIYSFRPDGKIMNGKTMCVSILGLCARVREVIWKLSTIDSALGPLAWYMQSVDDIVILFEFSECLSGAQGYFKICCAQRFMHSCIMPVLQAQFLGECLRAQMGEIQLFQLLWVPENMLCNDYETLCESNGGGGKGRGREVSASKPQLWRTAYIVPL